MWNIKSISAENFTSFKHVEYSFDKKCYIVRAENKDNQGQKSNGGGKSSFIDIISIGLLGYTLTGRTIKNCVGWDAGEGPLVITLQITNEEHSLDVKISRTIYNSNKSQELVLLVNDKVPKEIPSKRGVVNGVDVKLGNQYILQNILDITEEDLLNYYLISGVNYQPFLGVNTDRKLEVITRFTNTGAIDKVISYLETEEKANQNKLNEVLMQIERYKGAIEALQESLGGEAQKAWEESRDTLITDLNAKLDSCEADIMKLEDQIDALRAKDYKIHPIDNKKLQSLQARFDIKYSKWEQLQTAGKELNKKISTIETHLAGAVECPNCNYTFKPGSNNHYTSVDLLAVKNQYSEFPGKIDAIGKEMQEINDQMGAIKELEEENESTQRKLASKDTQIGILEDSQKMLIERYEQIKQEIESVANQTFDSLAIEEQIAEKDEHIAKLEGQADGYRKSDTKTWITHFEDFKFYLGNKPINLICSLVNQYLKLNQSDLNVHIEGFKLLRSGETRQALTPVIYRNWMNPQDYQQFSGGEKVRLNISVDLAFQQLINSSSRYGGLNLYISDELLNSLDDEGVKNAAEAFNKLDKTILLVTHSGNDLNYSNCIDIVKENGVSKLV